MEWKYTQFGMNRNRQHKDSMLFITIAYIGLTILVIGIVIGRII
jgi:hypothetical protein